MPGADCYSNELIALAGGVNVFGQRNGSSLEVSEDELAAAMPEIGFVSWCGVAFDKLDCARLLQRPALAATPMVRNRRVFALDERFSGRPGPRMVTAIEEMARVIRDCR